MSLSNLMAARRRLLISAFLKDHRILKDRDMALFDCAESTIRKFLLSLSDAEMENEYVKQLDWLKLVIAKRKVWDSHL